MRYCCAFGCRNASTPEATSRGISFHSFPYNEDLKKKWAIKIRRVDPDTGRIWEPTRYSVLCSEHFEVEDFAIGYGGYGGRRLKATAIPANFVFSRMQKQRKRPRTRSLSTQTDIDFKSSILTIDTVSGSTPKAGFNSVRGNLLTAKSNAIIGDLSKDESKPIIVGSITSNCDTFTGDPLKSPSCNIIGGSLKSPLDNILSGSSTAVFDSFKFSGANRSALKLLKAVVRISPLKSSFSNIIDGSLKSCSKNIIGGSLKYPIETACDTVAGSLSIGKSNRVIDSSLKFFNNIIGGPLKPPSNNIIAGSLAANSNRVIGDSSKAAFSSVVSTKTAAAFNSVDGDSSIDVASVVYPSAVIGNNVTDNVSPVIDNTVAEHNFSTPAIVNSRSSQNVNKEHCYTVFTPCKWKYQAVHLSNVVVRRTLRLRRMRQRVTRLKSRVKDLMSWLKQHHLKSTQAVELLSTC